MQILFRFPAPPAHGAPERALLLDTPIGAALELHLSRGGSSVVALFHPRLEALLLLTKSLIFRDQRLELLANLHQGFLELGMPQVTGEIYYPVEALLNRHVSFPASRSGKLEHADPRGETTAGWV